MKNFANVLKILEINEKDLINCATRQEQIKLVRKAARIVIKDKRIHPDISEELTHLEANANTRLTLEARDKLIEAINEGIIPLGISDNSKIDSPFIQDLDEAYLDNAIRNFSQKRKEVNKAESKNKKFKDQYNATVEKINKVYFETKGKIKDILHDDDDEPEI